MRATSSMRHGVSIHPNLFLLLALLAVLMGLLSGRAKGADGQASQPASDNTPDRTIIIERQFWPQHQIGEAYRQGLREGYAQGRTDTIYNARTEKLLRTRDDALQAGLSAFSQGRYDQAADYFLLATELDHADPASRIHAAQALFALEQYAEAVQLIRRAFELQPRLIHVKYDLRTDYPDATDFADQLHAFRRFLAEHPDWQEGHLLLGYQLLYSGQRAEAHRVLAKAVSLDPLDKLAARFHKASVPLPAARLPKTRPLQPGTTPSAAPPSDLGRRQQPVGHTDPQPASPAAPTAGA